MTAEPRSIRFWAAQILDRPLWDAYVAALVQEQTAFEMYYRAFYYDATLARKDELWDKVLSAHKATLYVWHSCKEAVDARRMAEEEAGA